MVEEGVGYIWVCLQMGDTSKMAMYKEIRISILYIYI